MPLKNNRFLFIVLTASFLTVFFEISIPRLLSLKLGIFNIIEYLPYLYLSFAIGAYIAILFKKQSVFDLIFGLLPGLITLSLFTIIFSDNKIVINIVLFSSIAFTGSLISYCYNNAYSNKVYFFDMVGIGIGGIIAFFLIPLAGLEKLFIYFSIFISIVSFSIIKTRFLKIILSVIIILNVLLLAGSALTGLPIDYYTLRNKFIHPEQEFVMHIENNTFQPTIIATEWGLISRVDMVSNSSSPMKHFFLGEIDSSNKILEINPDYTTDTSLYYNGGYFTPVSTPFYFKDILSLKSLGNYKEALLIGIGGGIDFHTLGNLGIEKITGAEINDAAVNTLNKHVRPGYYNSKKPDNQVFIIDGRSLIKFSPNTYDLILMSFAELYIPFPNSKVFIESYLYTKEAIAEAFSKLNDGGVLIFNKWSSVKNVAGNKEMLKLSLTALEAIKDLGIANPEKHLYVMAYNFGFTFAERDSYVSLYLFKNPDKVPKSHLQQLVDENYLSLLYTPFMKDESLSDGQNSYFTNEIISYVKHLKADSTSQYFEKSTYNLFPATDNKPFFYEFDKAHTHSTNFLLTFFVIIVGLTVPLFFIIRKQTLGIKAINLLFPFLVFFFLGIGFSLLQISLLQKFTVYLGSPIYSLLIIFCIFPVFIGTAGYFSRNIKNRHFILFSLILLLTVIIYHFFLNNILTFLFYFSLIKRILITSLLLMPYALTMGVFFPGIIKQYFDIGRIPAMLYMINIFGSAFGIILGAFMAILWGFVAVEYIAVFIYFLIGFFVFLNNFLTTKHFIN